MRILVALAALLGAYAVVGKTLNRASETYGHEMVNVEPTVEPHPQVLGYYYSYYYSYYYYGSSGPTTIFDVIIICIFIAVFCCLAIAKAAANA